VGERVLANRSSRAVIIDLVVGAIIGAAFGNIVWRSVDFLIMPPMGSQRRMKIPTRSKRIP
jgi:large-conductance mechanosensitive channel